MFLGYSISTVTVSPTEITTMVGDTNAYMFTCTVSIDCTNNGSCTADTLTITWIMNGVTINNEDSLFDISETGGAISAAGDVISNITIQTPVSISHAGVYMCNASLIDEVIMSDKATLSVTSE